jgi:hypothetical protein
MISHSKPSPLSHPCPNPACMAVIEQANAYVLTKLAGRLAADYTPLFTSPAYLANRAELVTALTVGDLDATKVVCRAWCRVVIGWTTAHGGTVPAEEAAA